MKASRTRVRVCFLAVASLMVLATLTRAGFSWAHGSQLGHVAGAWTTLAIDLSRGLFYRPLYSEGIGYGGTRYLPLYFALHAVVIRLIGHPIAAGFVVSFLSTALLLVGVFTLLRRSGLGFDLAAGFSALVLTSWSVQHGLTTIRGDILPTALTVWGLAMCVGEPARRKAGTAAALFALAFSAKITALHGLAAAVLWMTANGRAKAAVRLAALGAASCLVVLGVVHVTSDGRFLEILRVCAAGGAGASDMIRAPLRLFLHLRNSDPAGLVFCCLAVATMLARGTWRAPDLPTAFFGVTLAMTLVMFGSPGVEANHLVYLHVASIFAVASFFAESREHPAWDFQLAAATAAGMAGLALVVSMLAWSDVPVNRAAEMEEAARAARGPAGPILSEDPLVPVVAGQDPYLMDSFMFRVIRERRPTVAEPLFAAVRKRAFSAVVLAHDPALEAEGVYRSKHFGAGFVEEVQKSYVLSAKIGDFFVYLPRRD